MFPCRWKRVPRYMHTRVYCLFLKKQLGCNGKQVKLLTWVHHLTLILTLKNCFLEEIFFFCSCSCKGEILVILGIWDKMVSKALYQVPQNLLKIKLYWKSKFFFLCYLPKKNFTDLFPFSLKHFIYYLPLWTQLYRMLASIYKLTPICFNNWTIYLCICCCH